MDNKTKTEFTSEEHNLLFSYLSPDNNHYQVLGLPEYSELTDVKKAYKGLILKHHPDK